jgi:putative PIN family toxin of toxin-antitoxin system
MTRFVLDTNVLVSGMINAFGAPGNIVNRLREATAELAVDDRILAEYAAVLRRRKFRPYFSPREVGDVLGFLESNSHYVVPTVHVNDLPNPHDAPFLETALAAQVPLVTGNIRDFPATCCRSVTVLTPAQFLDRGVKQSRGARSS